MVMGHELTHGFDDEGRQFDGEGNLRDWWTPADGKASSRTARRASSSSIDGYVVVDDVHLNGKLTLGENIADLGDSWFLHHLPEGGRAPRAARNGRLLGTSSDTSRLRAELAPVSTRARSGSRSDRPPCTRALASEWADDELREFAKAFGARPTSRWSAPSAARSGRPELPGGLFEHPSATSMTMPSDHSVPTSRRRPRVAIADFDSDQYSGSR